MEDYLGDPNEVFENSFMGCWEISVNWIKMEREHVRVLSNVMQAHA